ncbi:MULTISPECIES: DoxX family protein [unclassified Pseudomonas]|uniref:HvfX family Cu-binding RiPP maturation protein n=1 Tax=unclassified Pseudomonas TaxID=196821 RepID=UPI002446E15F|nr:MULTISPECIES: DoxX family protein [unclassified Pseudomonas]MDG9922668.1 DoxX family protein [Pseudomonas sp. GD04045]MDH0033199.1 DoxX family protein [Pseudomonas sp. GD04019]
MLNLLNRLQDGLDATRRLDFLAPLLLRLYLVPIFWMAGTYKLADMDSTIAWFGNPDWGLGLPFPALLAWLAALTEAGGAILLLCGLAVRWISVPLMATMLVAIFTVHWEFGWQAIADASAPFANERVLAAGEKLERARELLQEHGNYAWLTGSGKFVVLNNGIEFAVTYLVMLLTLFFIGAGRWLSIDHWLAARFRQA